MSPNRFAPIVLGSLAVGVVVLAFGNFTGDGEGGAVAFIVTTLVMIAVALLVWNFIVTPRVEGPRAAATTGIILGVLAVLFGLEYWTGLAFALGPAAIALGLLAGERALRSVGGRRRAEQLLAEEDPGADVASLTAVLEAAGGE